MHGMKIVKKTFLTKLILENKNPFPINFPINFEYFFIIRINIFINISTNLHLFNIVKKLSY
jgi:hypothetical protein